MATIPLRIHPGFKLNGIPHSGQTLKEVGYDLIKEGAEHEKAIGDFLLDWSNDRPTVAVNTSGSTGKPKSILLKKENMIASAKATGSYFGLKQGDKALLCLPADYIAGKMMLVRAMVLGLELDYVAPGSLPLKGISKQYDFAAMIPLQTENSLAELKYIKRLIIGGAPVSEKLLARLKLSTTDIFETYGMTETITHIAVRAINGKDNTDYFTSLPGITVKADNRECLVIYAPEILDGPLVTNDIVNLKSKTEFEWLGRFDNVINSGGIKLSPEKLEKKMAPFITDRFFLTGLEDAVLGQKLVLVLESKNVAPDFLPTLKKSARLEKFETPKGILALTDFRETPNGKVDRKATLRLYLK
ncbi:MAG: AMP-binding protein [Sediminicola sp.]